MRYLPHTENQRREMLKVIGAPSVDALFQDVPADKYLKGPLDLPHHLSEIEVERQISEMAGRNMHAGAVPSFLGAGAYRHHIPATVDYIIQRGEFLTSYTPYQPEIAQGTLQYLFEFQTQVARLFAMDVANASMYDGSTACVEAVAMANRITGRKKAILSGNLHPHYRDVVKTNARYSGFRVKDLPMAPAGEEDLISQLDDQTSCVVVQYPDFFGHVRDYHKLAEVARQKGIMLVSVTTEVVSLGALEPPGAWGADIAVGEGQSIGNGLNFGGPYVGLFTCRSQYLRQMPGRLCGETVDADGKRGFVLTLSTREQHIRREKATSNICTNSGLCALAFTVHMSLLGESGLAHLAQLNHAKASQLKERLAGIPGVKVLNTTFFNEFTLDLGTDAARVVKKLVRKKILAGVPVGRFDKKHKNLLLVTATELTREAEMDAFAEALKEVLA